MLESEATTLEVTEANKASVRLHPQGGHPEFNASSSARVLTFTKSNPKRTYICRLDLAFKEASLVRTIKNNTQFAKEVIRRPLRLPEYLNQPQIIYKFKQISEELFLCTAYAYMTKPRMIYYFRLNLLDLETKDLEFQLISKGEVPISEKVEVKDPLRSNPHRVSSKNLYLMSSEYMRQPLTSSIGVKRHLISVIGQVVPMTSPSKDPIYSENKEEEKGQKPFKPLFFLDPKIDKFYWSRRLLKNDPNINIEGSTLERRIEHKETPSKIFHQEFPRSENSTQKIVTFVEVLNNLDLVLIIFDPSKKKVLKKTYVFFKEILTGLGLISKLLINNLGFHKCVLNPFKNTLHINFNMLQRHTAGSQQEDQRETQRLVDLGFDVSKILKHEPNARIVVGNNHVVEVTNCFEPEKRTFSAIKGYLSTSEKNCIRKAIKGEDLELSFWAMKGSEESKIMISHDKSGVSTLPLVSEVDEDTVLLRAQNKVVLVDKKTSYVLDKKTLLLNLRPGTNEAPVKVQTGKMMIYSAQSSFKLFKWEDKDSQQLSGQDVSRPRIEQALDFKSLSNFLPNFKRINRVLDVRFLEFDENILSVLFFIEQYLTDKKQQYKHDVFHGLFDLRTNDLVNYSVIETESRLHHPSGLDSAGNIYFTPRMRQTYHDHVCQLVLPKNPQELAQLLEGRQDGDQRPGKHGCLIRQDNQYKLTIKISPQAKQGYLEDRYFFEVEAEAEKHKRVLKYRLKDSLFQGEELIKEVTGEDVDLIAAYECKHPDDRVWFDTDNKRRLRILVGSKTSTDLDDGLIVPVPSTSIVALDAHLKPVLNVEVNHDKDDGFLNLGPKSRVNWIGDQRLFIASDVCRPDSEDPIGYRSLILDAKNQKVYRMMLKDGEEELLERTVRPLWVHGDRMLISHALQRKHGEFLQKFCTLRLSA